MRRFFMLVMVSTLLYACKSGMPKEIMPPDKMEKVLYDIHVVDGYITTFSNKDSATLVAASYYKGIFNKFDIDSASYSQSMDYYYSHPDVMDKIYEKVMATFKEEKAKNDKAVEAALAAKQDKKKYLSVEGLSDGPSGFSFGINPFNHTSL